MSSGIILEIADRPLSRRRPLPIITFRPGNDDQCRNDVDSVFFFHRRRTSYLQKRHGWPICQTLMIATGGALKRTPFIIVLITAGSIDCPSITLATRTRCGCPGPSPHPPWEHHPSSHASTRGWIFGPMDPSRFADALMERINVLQTSLIFSGRVVRHEIVNVHEEKKKK